jgi:hypothetical protein
VVGNEISGMGLKLEPSPMLKWSGCEYSL